MLSGDTAFPFDQVQVGLDRDFCFSIEAIQNVAFATLQRFFVKGAQDVDDVFTANILHGELVVDLNKQAIPLAFCSDLDFLVLAANALDPPNQFFEVLGQFHSNFLKAVH